MYKINPPVSTFPFCVLIESSISKNCTKPLKDMGRGRVQSEPRTCCFESVVSGPQWSGKKTAGMYRRSLGGNAPKLSGEQDVYIRTSWLVHLDIFTYFYPKNFWKICILTHFLLQLVLKPTVFITVLRQPGIPKQQLHILVVLETYEVEPHIALSSTIISPQKCFSLSGTLARVPIFFPLKLDYEL